MFTEKSRMIARTWHGTTSASKADAYLKFLIERAIPDYQSIAGNRGDHSYIVHLQLRQIGSRWKITGMDSL